MAIEISSAVLAAIRAEAAAAPGREICGLLFGGRGRIAAARPARNVAADPARTFELDPVALFAAHRAQRAGGPCLIGHYHSHPSGRAMPSAIDAAAAAGDSAIWLILGGDDVQAWRSTAPGRLAHEALVTR